MNVRQQGFTLVEVMVAVAVFSVVSLAMAGTFLVGYRAIQNEARVIAADNHRRDEYRHHHVRISRGQCRVQRR